MIKILSSFAVIAALLGLSLINRSDISYSVPIGFILIAISGILIFFSIKTFEEKTESKRKSFLEEISLKDIKSSMKLMTDCMDGLMQTLNNNNKQIINQISENNSTALSINNLLEQLPETIYLLEEKSFKDIKASINKTADNLDEIKKIVITHDEQIINQISETNKSILGTNNLLEQLPKEIHLLEEKSFNDIKASINKTADNLDEFNKAVSIYDKQIINQISETNTSVLGTNNILEQLSKEIDLLEGQQEKSRKAQLEAISDELKGMASAQSKITEDLVDLNNLLLDEVRNILTEFSEKQSESATDATDHINRTMRLTNEKLDGMALSLEKFSVKNADTIKKSVEGYKQFEVLMNKTLDQITSISNQDYDLLKDMIK